MVRVPHQGASQASPWVGPFWYVQMGGGLGADLTLAGEIIFLNWPGDALMYP